MSEVKTLVTLVLGGMFDHQELGDIDIVYEAQACEALQLELIDSTDDVHVELVSRIDFDAAQVELAALREELEDYRRRVTTVNSQLAAASYELSEARDAYLNQTVRLTAAEQRNANLVELLRELDENWNSHDGRERFSLAMRKVEAALKPTESGASE